MAPMIAYTVKVSEDFENDLSNLSEILNISKAGVIQRAIKLLKFALEADEIKLIKDGQEQKVLLK